MQSSLVTRRSMLQTTAAAAGLTLISSKAGAKPPSERLVLGFIGVGTMGRGHLGACLGHKDIEVAAICDVVKERRDDAVARVQKKQAENSKSGSTSKIQVCTDFRELLANKDLDAVLIATPDHWHAIPCILAAQAGKHIYCEKPLTHNIAEGRRLVNEVAKAKVVFQTGSQQRSEFDNRFRTAVEYVWNGRIGKLHTIRIGVGNPAKPCDLPAESIPDGTDWNLWQGPAPERPYNSILCPKGIHKHFPQWRDYQEYAGGGLADMGAHHFDIAQWAMEMDASGPSEIIPPKDPKANGGLKFIYSNKVVMIHNEFEGDLKADCVFEGTDGKILVSRGKLECLPDKILKQPLAEKDRRVMPSHNHRQNWLDAIRSGKSTICSAETGHRSAAICHLANIGYRLRHNLLWDPKSETFQGPNAQDANALLSRQARGEWSRI